MGLAILLGKTKVMEKTKRVMQKDNNKDEQKM